ncbi:hypothetical protein GPJ56_004796 [Histomonas meleagridis]|uniref:uncharacterized protein n=1 Tax=Histomonas meleagridis TaxID=135588 RepID=UPI00355A86B3|nr:hypothetical protein GPJ56_004796 [Histomonas meleagridis]KAH0801694.1 hypothetical protein GO595_005529 [Histomonas meleagridis]
MNTTIISLIASSLAKSPFISLRGETLISKCIFSRHFATILHGGYNFKSNAKISSTTFRDTLGTAIRISNSGFEDLIFNSPQEITNSSNLEITHCLFINCNSNQQGGALKFGTTSTIGTLRISKTGFHNCRNTKEGGAFYVKCTYFEMSSVCIDQCSAETYSAGCFFGKYNKAIVENSYITSISGSESGAVLLIENNEPSLRASNITSVTCANGRSIAEFGGYSSQCLKVSNILFLRCSAQNILYFSEQYAATISTINFIKNRGTKNLVYLHPNCLTVTECAFIEDESERFFNDACFLKNCVFSGSDQAKIPDAAVKQSLTFDAGFQTFQFNIPNSDACWNLMTKDTAGTGGGGSSASTILAFLLLTVAVIGIAFVVYKFWKSRRQGEALLKMYSSV